MKDVKAFLKIKREKKKYRDIEKRLKDYKDVALVRTEEKAETQASRCMDCGVPFCHWACPVANFIPEFNDAVMSGQWNKAYRILAYTSNLPEITGRVCPALCEKACVLGINDDPITICNNELNIIEYAFRHGLVKPNKPKKRTGKKIAVIGSGPAGLSAAAQLNSVGHNVTVFERDKEIGGLMRYGIPDFKLEKNILKRRIDIWKKEGIEFKTSVNVGVDITADKLLKDFDIIVIAIGSRVPRDLPVKGRELKGIYFAMDYLSQSNKRVSKESYNGQDITAKDKRVVVIGGGDTGSDCVGTANRQGAKSVTQIELLPKPSQIRTEYQPWPTFPNLLKTTSSHEEGVERIWSVLTKEFKGEDGKLEKLCCVKVDFINEEAKSRPVMKEIPGSEFEINADLAVLAVGFVRPETDGVVKDLGLELDSRGNIKTDKTYLTSNKKVFAIGDANRGQSLIVHAMSQGRRGAYNIDKFLMSETVLPDF